MFATAFQIALGEENERAKFSKMLLMMNLCEGYMRGLFCINLANLIENRNYHIIK